LDTLIAYEGLEVNNHRTMLPLQIQIISQELQRESVKRISLKEKEKEEKKP
jgi:hypothetical protein